MNEMKKVDGQVNDKIGRLSDVRDFLKYSNIRILFTGIEEISAAAVYSNIGLSNFSEQSKSQIFLQVFEPYLTQSTLHFQADGFVCLDEVRFEGKVER